MSSTAETGSPIIPAAGPLPATRARIDALVSGDYDQHAFLREVQALVNAAPEETCEILSVIDQYYRRGKIHREAYQRVESYLGALLVRGQQNTCISVPLPQRPGPLPAVLVAVPAGPIAPRPAIVEQSMPNASAAVAGEVEKHARGLVAGDVLRGRYRVVAVIGQGGMGTIWEAIDQYLVGVDENNRRLAIKVLHTEVARRPRLMSELLGEFVHLRSLSHPNIVRVHEFDRDGDTAFLTMELLKGASLCRLLSVRNGTALKRAHAHAVIRDVGAALAHAHSRGLAHGDINPQNIFLTNNGEVRVLDFGSSHRLKSVASIFGTDPEPPILAAAPSYASCEVLEGLAPDTRDDVFALACVAYFLLSGKHPFANRTAIEARTALLIPARPAKLTARQWNALREGLDCRRHRRPSDVAQWVHRLNPTAALQPLPKLSVLLTVPPPQRRTGLMASLGTALILLAAGGVWMTNNRGQIHAFAATMRADVGRSFENSHHYIVNAWNHALKTAVMRTGAGGSLAGHPAPDRHSLAPAPIAPKSPLAARSPIHARGAAAASTAPARIELATNLIQVSPGSSFARVVVRRRGNLRGAVSFTWWTESGTATPGRDFAGFAAHMARIEAGRGHLSLFIPIVADPTRHESRRFYVKIADPDPGVRLGERTIAMITIPASE